MTIQISKSLIEDIAMGAGLDPEEQVRTDYSGRGMFGDSCLGITGNISDLVSFVQEAVGQHEQDIQGNDETLELRNFVRYLADVTEDSMGLDSIFYWRSIQVTD